MRKDSEALKDITENAEEIILDIFCRNRDSFFTTWQSQGLMPEDDRGYLVWKCVGPDGRGVLGCPYEVGKSFKTKEGYSPGMATAGPWGAVKEYGSWMPYVLAIRVPAPIPLLGKDGVVYADEGVPVAKYRITQLDDEGFGPLLGEGEDEMALLTGVRTMKDPNPDKSTSTSRFCIFCNESIDSNGGHGCDPFGYN
jgi:hypothetical protein